MNIINITSQIPSGNYSTNRNNFKPSCIVLHITGDSNKGQAVNWFKDSNAKVSAHYVIEKDGSIIMCVHPKNKAYHCGIVQEPTAQIYFDRGNVNPNSYTIGIECVSSGESLTDAQYSSLTELMNKLCEDYNIPKTRYYIIGHNELDTIDRKFDPVSSYSVDEILRRMGVIKLTVEEAIKILVEKGIISSPEYWDKAKDVCFNFSQLLINMATFVQNK